MSVWLTEQQITDILLQRMAAEEEGWRTDFSAERTTSDAHK